MKQDIEFSKFIGISIGDRFSSPDFIVLDQIGIYKIEENAVRIMMDNKEASSISCNNGHVWYDDSAFGGSTCVECGISVGNAVLSMPHAIGEDWVVGCVMGNSAGDMYLTRYDYSKGEVIDERSRFCISDADDNFIVSKSAQEVVCRNHKLDRIWFFSIDRKKVSHQYSAKSQRPFIFRDVVIINHGMKGQDGKIAGHHLKSGEVIWEFTFSGDEILTFLHNEKYHICSPSGVILLDPETGVVKGDFPLPLPWPMCLTPFGENYLAYGGDQLLCLNGDDLSAISSQVAPEGFRFSATTMGYPSEKGIALYLECKGRAISTAKSGMMFIPFGTDFSRIDIEPEISMLFMEALDQSGEKIYFFTVSEPDIDRLLRLSAIQIMETCCLRGVRPMWSADGADTKHKGKIKLVIDREGLPDNAEEQIREWVGALTEHLQKMAIYPGAGDQYRFSIDVEFK